MTRAVVLGSGGTRGGAWMVGALLALRDAGTDVADADLVVGTSAGSLLAALLTLGVDLEAIARHQHKAQAADDPVLPLDYDDIAAAAALMHKHPFRPGEPHLLLAALAGRTPERLLPTLAGLLPRGDGDAHLVGRTVRAAMPSPTAWPEQLRIMVLDASTGRRRSLGPADGVPLDEAVSASCAVPGVFAPVPVQGHRWYDGGFASADSADLAGWLPDARRVDEAVVLSPVTVLGEAWPPGLPSWVERRARASLARLLTRELTLLRAAGVDVTLLQPVLADLQLMGPDLMAAGDLGPIVDLARQTVAHRLSDDRTTPAAASSTRPVGVAAR